jgi:hypothetical protein
MLKLNPLFESFPNKKYQKLFFSSLPFLPFCSVSPLSEVRWRSPGFSTRFACCPTASWPSRPLGLLQQASMLCRSQPLMGEPRPSSPTSSRSPTGRDPDSEALPRVAWP